LLKLIVRLQPPTGRIKARHGAIETKERHPRLFGQLKKEIARENEFEIGVIRLEAGGYCKNCRPTPRRNESPPEAHNKPVERVAQN